jgi:hypothetical protein
VVCDEEGNGNSCKSNGNEGDEQVSATNQHRGGGMCCCGSGKYWQDALIKSIPRPHLRWIFAIIWRQNSNFFSSMYL